MDLKPMNLAEINKNKNKEELLLECFVCNESIKECEEIKIYLSHLLTAHHLVISEVDKIGDFKKYANYWQNRLKTLTLGDICFKINTNTGEHDIGEVESYYLLCDNLPEDKEIREKLNIHKLEKALKQQEIERNDHNYQKVCFFCSETIGNNKNNILDHMQKEHNFSIGKADNIVYFDHFYKMLNDRFESLQCLYCDKIFYDKRILKEHMRKKQHKCIDPNNKQFDRFYIINYLEYRKVWHDIKSEKDVDEDNDFNKENEDKKDSPSIEDWNDPIQTYFCLFCENSFENEDDILSHMMKYHKFDLKKYLSENNLSFYNQVKLINYIRQQMFSNNCFVCKGNFDSKEQLLSHLNDNEHLNKFPEKDYWDLPDYYFSTFEDDNLLCLLDDEAYDESKIQVIPENMEVKINEEIVKNLKDLKC